jgi:hypothetical protein
VFFLKEIIRIFSPLPGHYQVGTQTYLGGSDLLMRAPFWNVPTKCGRLRRRFIYPLDVPVGCPIGFMGLCAAAADERRSRRGVSSALDPECCSGRCGHFTRVLVCAFDQAPATSWLNSEP